jgi:hypothetical protein
MHARLPEWIFRQIIAFKDKSILKKCLMFGKKCHPRIQAWQRNSLCTSIRFSKGVALANMIPLSGDLQSLEISAEHKKTRGIGFGKHVEEFHLCADFPEKVFTTPKEHANP